MKHPKYLVLIDDYEDILTKYYQNYKSMQNDLNYRIKHNHIYKSDILHIFEIKDEIDKQTLLFD